MPLLIIKYYKILVSVFLTLAAVCGSCQSVSVDEYNSSGENSLVLKDGWIMQSSLQVEEGGAIITSADYQAQNWHQVSVPTTIIGGLLDNDYYDFDPFMGQNFKKLSDPSLDKPWWFRTGFDLGTGVEGKAVILKMQGINYKANVWLNGQIIADSTTVKGPMRIIELDISKFAKRDSNVLALEILRPFRPNRKDGDLAIDYADWIHYPPDYNGGIINDVVVNVYDRVGVQYPHVVSHFDLPSLDIVHLTVHALVTNYSDKPQLVDVIARINNQITVSQQLLFEPGERRDVAFRPEQFPELNVKNPRIWWPWQYGDQPLNRINVSVQQNHKVCSSVSDDFGIREITSTLVDNTTRVFMVNGKKILLRGAAWSPDIFQRRTRQRQEQEIKLYRDMHLNVIRSEGKFEDDHFYDLCDQYGILVMTGWMCCGAWQYPENWSKAERAVAMASDSSMMYWLRSKACIMAWLNGSDMPPRDPSVERDYLSIEKSLHWPNPILATANEYKSKVSGYSGVKMAGPYEWVPPIYWETDRDKVYGGAWGFATEISPGPSIPPYESLIRFLPPDGLWYDSDDWNYHCGTMKFGNTAVFNKALFARYGHIDDMKEYAMKAQAMNYEAHRAMMEAYGLHKYKASTGVIQWMGANPWPSLIWHTFDYYLNPGGTYFGIKKALEPVHIQYSYADKGIYLVNSYLNRVENAIVRVEIYNLNGNVIYEKELTASVEADAISKVLTLPEVNSSFSDTYFLRLELRGADNLLNNINWYWLSKKNDVLNWKKSNWWMTPQSAFADFTSLQGMAKTKLNIQESRPVKSGTNLDSICHKISLQNVGKTVAFQVRVRVARPNSNGAAGESILPVIYDDNFIELAPGESRTITCAYAAKDCGFAINGNKNLAADGPIIEVTGWNLDISDTE